MYPKVLAALGVFLLLQACGSGSSITQSAPPAVNFVNWSSVQRITVGDSTYSAFAMQATGGVVVYTDNYNGLSLVDDTNLEQISVHKKLVDPQISDGAGHGSYDAMYAVAVAGNMASVAVIPGCIGWCMDNPPGQIRLYDVAERSKAVYLATVTSPLSPQALLAEGNYLYVSGTNSLTLKDEFAVIDITDPKHPKRLGAVDIDDAGPLAKKGNRVFISQVQVDGGGPDNFKNILAIDVSDPSAPVLIRSPAPGFGFRYSPIVVSGNVAYVSDWDNGLYVVNITDILSPSAFTIAQPDAIYDMASCGNYLYLACGTGGLRIYNIKNPEEPLLVKTISTSTSVKFVSVTNGRGVYITEGTPNSPLGQELNVFYVDEMMGEDR